MSTEIKQEELTTEASMEQTEVTPVVEEKKGPSKEDRAAFDYKQGVPRCIALASNMKAGEIARVFANLLQFPLVDHPKKFRSKNEETLFILSLRVMDAKNTIMQHFETEVDAGQREAAMSMHEEIAENKGQTTEPKLEQQETTTGENNDTN